MLDLMESFGAFWTFMVLTVGAIAREAVNRKKNDLQLEHVFKEHGHTNAGKFFGKKGEGGEFNWETERYFVDLLMRDRGDELGGNVERARGANGATQGRDRTGKG